MCVAARDAAREVLASYGFGIEHYRSVKLLRGGAAEAAAAAVAALAAGLGRAARPGRRGAGRGREQRLGLQCHVNDERAMEQQAKSAMAMVRARRSVPG